MIKKYVLQGLEKAINATLALDDTIQDQQTALRGRVLKLIVTPPAFDFFILFHDKGVRLEATWPGEADTTLQSSPIGYLRLAITPASKVHTLFHDAVIISGDVALGSKVKQLFETLDIDWEGHLAKVTGDVIAYQCGSLIRQGIRYKKHFTESMRHNLTEYLQEECTLMPPREEVNDFCNAVDTLSLDVERLSARIQHIIQSTR